MSDRRDLQWAYDFISTRGGGEEGPDPEPDPSPDDVTQSDAFKRALEKATAGLRSNRDELLTEKKRAKEELDALKRKVEGLGDIDKVRETLERVQADEETRLVAEGKIDEVLERRSSNMKRDFESRLNQATEQAETLKSELEKARSEVTRLTVGSKVDSAIGELECIPSARKDIHRAAREVFSLDPESGEIVARDENGELIFGRDGKTVQTPKGWLESQRQESPHWWGPSGGGGAPGGEGARGRRPHPSQLDGMSAREKIARSIGTR